MTNLPKFKTITNPIIKELIGINDMIRHGFTLGDVKAQANLKGFDLIAKARTFKAARTAVMSELKNNGLVII